MYLQHTRWKETCVEAYLGISGCGMLRMGRPCAPLAPAPHLQRAACSRRNFTFIWKCDVPLQILHPAVRLRRGKLQTIQSILFLKSANYMLLYGRLRFGLRDLGVMLDLFYFLSHYHLLNSNPVLVNNTGQLCDTTVHNWPVKKSARACFAIHEFLGARFLVLVQSWRDDRQPSLFLPKWNNTYHVWPFDEFPGNMKTWRGSYICRFRAYTVLLGFP